MKKIIQLLALMLLCGVVTCLGGWDEFLQDAKNGVRNIERELEEKKHYCVDCGKTIYNEGDRCVPCAWKRSRAKERLEEAKEAAEREWEKSTRYCKYCGKEIHGRSVCTECVLERAKPHIEDAARKTGEWASDHARAAGEIAKKDARHYKEALENSSDTIHPDMGPADLYNTLRTFRLELKKAHRESVEEIVRAIARHPVRDEIGEWSTLEAVARQRVAEADPELAKTDMFTDSAVPITAMILGNRRYFLNDFRFIKTRNGMQSITEHYHYTSGVDEEKAQTCLSLMDSICSLSNASDDGDVDFDAVADIYDSMREIANEKEDDRE